MSATFPRLLRAKAFDAALAIVGAGLLASLLLRSSQSDFSSQFLPHAYCYLYNRNLIVLHVVADGLIWLSYVAISLTLVYLVYRTRREIPFIPDPNPAPIPDPTIVALLFRSLTLASHSGAASKPPIIIRQAAQFGP